MLYVAKSDRIKSQIYLVPLYESVKRHHNNYYVRAKGECPTA